PANFFVQHSPDCERIGERRVKGTAKDARQNHDATNTGIFTQGGVGQAGYADADGLETIAAWRCPPHCPVRRLGEQSGVSKSNVRPPTGKPLFATEGRPMVWNDNNVMDTIERGHTDTGTAARFYHNADWSHEVAERLATCDPVLYQAKAGRKERDAGLEGMATVPHAAYGDFAGTPEHATNTKGKQRNIHPCCKPIALTRWLATLLLPPELYAPRRILIPFCGTMSEGIGALLAGWEEIVGIDNEREYVEIAEARLAYWASKPVQHELF
ncbi:unnamed protein product, partial [marine sediment metagenome]